MDITQWFHFIGFISALLLGAGFVLAIVSVFLSWEINKRQNIELKGLDAKNLETERKLEAERATRIELEEALTPRILTLTDSVIERLGRWNGTRYILEVFPDAESEKAAVGIRKVLTDARWVEVAAYNSTSMPGGVQVHTRGGVPFEEVSNVRAASELAEYLDANRWDAGEIRVNTGDWGEAERLLGEIPPGTLRVCVGRKPDRYFGQKHIDEITEAIRKKSPPGTRKADPEADRKARELFRSNTEERRKRLREEWGLVPR